MRKSRWWLTFGLGLAATVTLGAGEWPQWRGLAGRGVAEVKDLPVTWSATENVLWKVLLPGRSHATPALWG
jgi:hypothetical protein